MNGNIIVANINKNPYTKIWNFEDWYEYYAKEIDNIFEIFINNLNKILDKNEMDMEYIYNEFILFLFCNSTKEQYYSSIM